MSKTPPTDEPDDASTESESRERDLLDVESAFLEDRDPEAYPPVLRITSDSEERHRREALDRLERWESGESVPHVINFEKPSDLRSLLTDRRLALLRSVMSDRPASIRRLAERVDRDVKSVHDDLQILAEYDIVHFEQDGRAKRPFVPYETIEISLEISATSSADGAAPA